MSARTWREITGWLAIRVALLMVLTGHKTASVYHRYRIVAEDDLGHALARMQADLTGRTEGTVIPLREVRGTGR